LDIPQEQLLDWLVDRKKVNPQWKKTLDPIQKKISDAIQDMPSHPEIDKFMQTEKSKVLFFDNFPEKSIIFCAKRL
jgi:hypothetical protein